MQYTIKSPFGKLSISETVHGICRVDFLEITQIVDKTNIEKRLGKYSTVLQAYFQAPFVPFPKEIILDLQGTPFELGVWNCLRSIPFGQTKTYQDIACMIGNTKASRAVGHAIGKNSMAYLIPCHRVICTNGKLGGYRWGLEKKKALLRYESSKQFLANFLKH